MDANADVEFDNFDLIRAVAETYDDDVYRANSRYNVDESYANDIPNFFPSLGHRRRRGIIDECCRQPCRKVDLISFCPKRQY